MKKILIWGTGIIAEQVLKKSLRGNIIGFIETQKTKELFWNKPVFGIDEIPDKYDFIIIANSHVDEIYELCKKNSIDLERVIFLFTIKQRAGYTDLTGIREILGERNYTDYCKEFGLTENSFIYEDLHRYQELNTRSNFAIKEQYMWPIVRDKYRCAGSIGNYFCQDLWAAKLIIKSGITRHFDIGSRLDGFIAHLLAADIDVTMIDVREFPGEVGHLHTIVDDATSLHQVPDESIDSMSALCSLEHFGLGRYGDPVDPEACFKCFNNIQKKLKKGGRLYLSLPIGKERVEFNAHRVFYASTVADCFSSLQLKEFSCTSEGKMEYNVDIHKYDGDTHNGEYRYGLFMFVK